MKIGSLALAPWGIRDAKIEDLPWLNSAYDRVQFLHSDLSRDQVAIAWVGGERAGTGRLVVHGPGIAELGGMFVEPRYRGQGIADAIVTRLVEWGQPFSELYCIPFSHLSHFYERFGFRPCGEAGVPEAVLEKLGDCRARLENQMRLLKWAKG